MATELQTRPAPVEPPAASPAVSRAHPLLPVLVAVVLVMLAVAPFLPAMDSYFLGDDFGLIWLFEKKRLSHFPTLFYRPWTEDTYGIYADELRPTVGFSYWLDGRLFGSHNPFGFHLDNLLFHAACTLLVWGIARAIVRREGVAAVAGAIFAVQSIHPEAVTWISGRADLIPTFFYAGGFLAFVLFRQRGSWLAYGLAVLASVLALFSKQSGVTFLGLLVAYDLVYGQLGSLRGWRGLARRALPYAPFALALVGYLGLRRVLFGQSLREDLISAGLLPQFLGRQPFYLQGALFGGELTELFGPSVSPGEWLVLAGVLLGVAGLTAAWRRRRPLGRGFWRHVLFFGPVWFGICVLPLIVTYLSPRHLYAATVGSSILVALVLWAGVRRLATAQAAGPAVATALLLVGLWLRLAEGNLDWLDAAKTSEKMVQGTDQVAAALPARSKVVFFTAGSYGHTWLWMWSLPYATQPPFGHDLLYGRHEVIESPSTFCCPLDQWWRSRSALLRRWLNEGPAITIYTVGWNQPDLDFDVEPRQVDTARLRAELQAALGRPIEQADEASEEEISKVLRLVSGQ